MADPLTWTAAIGTALSVAGSAYQGIQASAAGEAQQRAMQYRAEQERVAAGQIQAGAQRRAGEDRLKTEIVLSAARAEAAGSGAGASDPTVVTNEGSIAARGAYNFDSALYIGNSQAAGLETQAGLDLFQGEQAAQAGQSRMYGGFASSAGTALTGAASLYSKYGSKDTSIDSSVSPPAYQETLNKRYGSVYRAGI